MTTPTVLRVKRRLEDNPQDALVLLCKRMKTDDEEISSLFVFCGTIDSQEATEVKAIVPKLNAKIKSPPNLNDIIEKMRKEKKESATEHRYEVVNCSRGIKEDSSNEDDDLFDLVDLQITTSGSGEKYIYDLYKPAKEDFDISMLDNLVSIENYETNLILGTYRENGEPGSDQDQDDDDDSNDENNWRNEYPDTEPSSIDEEDIVKAMENCDIDDDLSSDTGEDKIYDDPPNLFNEDVKRFGLAYAKYKAKVQGEDPDLSSTSFVHCVKVKDLDEEAVDGYKDDSDDGFYYGQEEDSEQFQEQYKDVSSDEFSPD